MNLSIFRRHALLLAATLVLGACTANPVREAESFEQKAFALYGTYVIFQGKAADLSKDPIVPEKVKAALRQADAVAYPVGESLVDAAIEVGRIRDVLTGCKNLPEPVPTCETTTELMLVNATNNLSSIYFSAQPKLFAVISAVKEARK